MASLWRDLPRHQRAPAPARAEPAVLAIKRGLCRLRAWKGCSQWFGGRHAERDPLAPLVETAKRLDYGAGRFNEPQDAGALHTPTARRRFRAMVMGGFTEPEDECRKAESDPKGALPEGRTPRSQMVCRQGLEPRAR
jgi:hypothetical protein